MLLAQLAAQAPDDLPLIGRLHTGYYFGRELLALHAGCGQHRLPLDRQAVNALGDDRLHPGWQRLPIQGRSLQPAALFILDEVTPLLHAS